MYVLNYHQQIERISRMIPLRKNEETFEVYYHDPQTGELWKSFFPHKEHLGKGPKILRPEPLPENIELQLEICINSGEEEDAKGLAIEYSLRPEKWEEIIDTLEANFKKYMRSGFLLFIKTLGVLDPTDIIDEDRPTALYPSIGKDRLLRLKKRARKLRWKKFFHFS